MAETEKENLIQHIISEVRKFAAFSDLSEDDLEWLAERMDEVQLAEGEVYAKPGDPVDYLTLVTEGELQFQMMKGPSSPVFIAAAGEVTGKLPFSRLTNFRGLGRAVMPTRMIRLHRKHFPELVQRIPTLAERLVALMSDRIREVTRVETQQDKLMALGKLSAGLAHELNNPAAAARRSAQSLMEALEKVRVASLQLLRHQSTEAQREAIFRFERDAGRRASEEKSAPSDPLELSDREEQITQWLDAHGYKDGWEIASTLAEGGLTATKLDELSKIVGTEIICDAVRRIASIITIFGLVQEIDNSTKRISDLVGAVKRYSYMGQENTPQEVDLREDLENTLKIFGHRLKSGITVVRDYDETLPRVCAYGSELNQVWTNLIDNAIDSMQGKGELKITTCKELDYAVVEIEDNGPGIPKEIQTRIFDPFFTTKKVGEGTGLGLDTVARIVRRHHGFIEVESEPGETCFTIRFPFKQPSTKIAESEDPAV